MKVYAGRLNEDRVSADLPKSVCSEVHMLNDVQAELQVMIVARQDSFLQHADIDTTAPTATASRDEHRQASISKRQLARCPKPKNPRSIHQRRLSKMTRAV